MEHVVAIAEYFVRHVIVEADNAKEALDKVSKAYDNGNIVLDYDNFVDSKITYCNKANELDQKLYEEI